MPKSIEDLEQDPDALETMDPADIEAAMEPDGDDGKGNPADATDPRGNPASAEEDRERGSSRPASEESADTSKDGGEGQGDTGQQGEGDTSAEGQQADGSEGSPSSEEEKPVQAADGQNTIPYSVLKSTREENKQLRQELEQLRQSNPGETTSTSEGGQGQEGDGSDNAGTHTDPNAYDWNQIAEEYGDEYARMMRERVEHEAKLEQRLAEQERRLQEREQAEQSQTASTVQEAIDTLPTLASWQSSDPAMWDAAKSVDQHLQNDPQWAHTSYSERFQEVVRRLRPDAPELQSSGGSGSESSGSADSDSGEGAPPPPTSHSDAPASTPPDSRSEQERLEDADPMDIEARIERMTPEQYEEWLAGL